jgi:hypothetical protein
MAAERFGLAVCLPPDRIKLITSLWVTLAGSVIRPVSISWSVSSITACLALALRSLVVFKVLLGLLGTRDAWRMHAMHLATLVGLLGVAGAIEGPIRAAIHGQKVEFGTRLVAQILMALLCAALLTLCVKSFVVARLRRK